MRMRMRIVEAGAGAYESGSPSAWPSGAVVVRKANAISSPGACGTRTGIFSSSFAGACVATEHGPETARSKLIGLRAGARETSCSCNCNEPERDDDPNESHHALE